MPSRDTLRLLVIAMRRAVLLCLTAISLSACASKRTIEGSHAFSAEISRLQQQEVLDNIDETIDAPYRIPRRTVFGKGGLTSSDSAALQVAVPLHLFNDNAGSLTGSAGASTDTYQLSVVPEVDGPALIGLRKIYQAVVFPASYPDIAGALRATLSTDMPLLFWTNLDGSPSSMPPPGDAKFIGQGAHHQIWARDVEGYYRFVLLTYGTSPSADRVSDTSSPVLVSALPSTQKGKPRSGPSLLPLRRGGIAGKPASMDLSHIFIPSQNKPLTGQFDTKDLFILKQQLQRAQPPQGDNTIAIPTQ